MNKYDFLCQQNGKRVHHVILPRWAYSDPFDFIIINRKSIESEIVSKNLHFWIDLIFGFKQKGKEAEKAMNVFFHLTYEDAVDFDKL